MTPFFASECTSNEICTPPHFNVCSIFEHGSDSHKSLPQFEGVGHFLRKKYQSAVLVTLDQSSNKLVNYDRIISKYGPQDLLYLEQSPNYCYKDVALGTAGTAGRECNKSSLSENSCDILCCGHGYNTKKVFHFAFIVCSSIAGWENSAWIM